MLIASFPPEGMNVSRIVESLTQGARWSAPKLRTTGPDRSNGPLVQTGLMIFLMVLDRSDCADGLVWTIGPNGPPMEFSMWNI